MSEDRLHMGVIVNAKADDGAGGNSTRNGGESHSHSKPQEGLPFNIDLALLAEWNPDGIGVDAVDAASREAHIDRQMCYLLELLADPCTCDARVIMLPATGRGPEARELFPEGWSSETDEYLDEFLWIALGHLRDAIKAGLTSLHRLGEIAGHPDWLVLAKRSFERGLESSDLQAAIERRRQATTRWLREEVDSGRVAAALGPSIQGKYLAARRPQVRYEELEIADHPEEASGRLAAKWLASREMFGEIQIGGEMPESVGRK